MLTQTGAATPIDNEFGYGQILSIILRRRIWFLSAFLATIGVAALFTYLKAPEYESSMQLLVEANYQGRKDVSPSLEDKFADSNVEIDNATQITLMRSSGLVMRAMKLLQPNYPEMDPNSPLQVNRFRQALTVGQLAEASGSKKVETKIFRISYSDRDPVKTRDVLNAMQTVYQDYNLEQQRLRLERGLDFLDKQLPEVRQEVRQAENALEQFRTQQGLIDPATQSTALIQMLTRIEQEQQVALTQIGEFRTRYSALQAQFGRSPQEALIVSRLSQSARFQSLLNEIQKTELTLVQQRLRFKDNTPFVQQVVDQRQRQLSLLQTEVNRVLQSNAGIVAGEDVLAQGQLGSLDVKLVSDFVEAESTLRAVQARAQTLSLVEAQLRRELQRFPNLLAEYSRLEPEVELRRNTLRQLLQARQELGLEIARGGFAWQVVEKPLLGQKIGPDLIRNLLLGAVAGLMLGGGAVFLRDATDDAVYHPDDLKRQVPLPLLGMVPVLPSRTDAGFLPFRRTETPDNEELELLRWRPFRESLDLLCKTIDLLGVNTPFQSLVITSALAGEGKSTIALALAMSAARLHRRVLLVDADLRRPSLHKVLGLPNDQGLSTLLASDAPIPTHVDAEPLDLRSNISVVTAGPTPIDPVKLLSSQRMKDMMAVFEENYDLVIVDAPPVLGMADTVLTASCCQGVIMIGRIGQSTRKELNQAIEVLNKLNVVGIVANGATTLNQNYTYYQV